MSALVGRELRVAFLLCWESGGSVVFDSTSGASYLVAPPAFRMLSSGRI